jgi:hypothetical protein
MSLNGACCVSVASGMSSYLDTDVMVLIDPSRCADMSTRGFRVLSDPSWAGLSCTVIPLAKLVHSSGVSELV